MSDIVESKKEVAEKKKRTRKCKNIMAVIFSVNQNAAGEPTVLELLEGWPDGITRMDKALKVAKDFQTDEAKGQRPVPEITFLRRLGTLKGKSQVVMSFCVE